MASPTRGGLQAAPPAPLAPGPGVDAPSFAAPRPPFPAVSTPARPASDPADSKMRPVEDHEGAKRRCGPAELMDDLACEIFLRLPPDEPQHLFRASLVCKRWLRLLTDPDFLRQYRAFHGAPPLLGYIQRRQVLEGDPDPRLVPTTAVPLATNPSFRRALDCRDGRVLVHVYGHGGHLLVWDPVTGDQQRVPDAGIDWLIYTAAVFCGASGCDHLDCHGGPFRVAFLATDDYNELVKATVYSSETGAWSGPVSLAEYCLPPRVGDERFRLPYVQPRRVALVGDDVYFTLRRDNAIVKYDLGENCLSVINAPPCDNAYYIALMEMEDGALGFSYIEGWNLYLWSRKVTSEGAAEWVQSRIVKLEGMIPVADPDDKAADSDNEALAFFPRNGEAIVVGSAEGVGIVFVNTSAGLFTFELKSGRVRKVDEPGVYFSVLPYMSFYTPDRGNLSLLANTR